MFCLLPKTAETFKAKLVSGELDPQKLADMSSEERRAAFGFMGDATAHQVNQLFEKGQGLKNQQTGMINWAKQVSGMKPETLKDIVSKVNKMDAMLNPKDLQNFKEDLVAHKLGTTVTMSEAAKISELAKEAQTQKDLNPNSNAYGRAALDLQDYVESLKPATKNIIANIANIPKTIMSTLDFSAALRQGWGMISRGEFYKALPQMFKYAFSKDAYRGLQADIIADPLYDTMKKSGLRISTLADKLSQREETYMSNLLSKVPGFAGSERAYVGFLNKLRTDVFKHLIKNADLAGEDVKAGSQPTKDIANVVNDFTGSGNIGKGDRYSGSVPALNATLFSPRKISATINMFNPERYLNPEISPTARKAALRQLIGSVAITGTVLGLAKMSGAKVETDSTSADFGKIASGKTRFEVTGGNSTYAVLISRLLQGKSKSSVSGKVTQLNAKDKKGKPAFGGETKGDLITSFARNKLSPNASFFADWLYGSDSIGNPFKVTTEIKNRVTPLIIQDLASLMKTDKGNVIQGVLGDMFGLGIQTY